LGEVAIFDRVRLEMRIRKSSALGHDLTTI
jgi:hypothetical protein